MAIVNPQVQPTQDPNWTNVFRPADGFIADKSKAIGLETLGQGIEGASAIVDTAIKKGIDKTANEQVDVQRDQFTAGIEKIKGDLNNGIIPPPVQGVAGTNAGKRSLLDSNAMADEAEVPAGLDSGLDRIDSLAAAKAAGSPRLNDTQYAAATLSIAKNLRSTYGEGYRDYIDERVSKASGLPVANSYYQNMLQDVNRQLVQMGKTKDDIQTLINSNPAVPGMAGYNARYKAGDPTITQPMIYKAVADYSNLQAQQKIDAANRAASNDSLDVKKRTAEGSLTQNFGDLVDQHLQGFLNLTGMPSLGDTSRYIKEVQAGQHPEATAPEIAQRYQQLYAIRQEIYAQGQKMGADVAPLIGGDKVNAVLSARLAGVDAMIALSKDKDGSAVHFAANQVQNIKDQDQYNMMISTDTGAISRQLLATRAILGENYFPTYIQNILGNSLDTPIAKMFSQEGLAAVQPYTDKRGQPVPRYMKDAVLHGKGVANDTNLPDDYFGNVVGLVKGIADPNMPAPAKDHLVDWAFNPKNKGILNELKMDYVDPNTGNLVPGKYRAFNILSSPDVTRSVAETSKAHPENYVKYKGTLENEFGNLYREDIKTLNGALYSKQTPVDQNGNPMRGGPNMSLDGPKFATTQSIHFSFDSGSNAFGLVDKNNRPITRENVTQTSENVSKRIELLDTLDRVNGGLRNLAYVHEHDPAGPSSTSKYLLQSMQTVGFRPGQEITGAGREMSKAIIKANAPETTNEQLNELLRVK